MCWFFFGFLAGFLFHFAQQILIVNHANLIFCLEFRRRIFKLCVWKYRVKSRFFFSLSFVFFYICIVYLFQIIFNNYIWRLNQIFIHSEIYTLSFSQEVNSVHCYSKNNSHSVWLNNHSICSIWRCTCNWFWLNRNVIFYEKYLLI